MLKVLQIGMTDNLGGIETFLINYYRSIDKKKINFDFVNIYDNPLYFEEELKKGKSKIYKLNSYYRNPIKYTKELIKIIQDNNYEIVHCNMNSAVFLWPLIASKIAGAKVIIAHSHNASSDKGFIKSILHWVNKHFIPLFANNFFACSEKAGKWFYSKRIINSNKFYVMKNAIEINKYKFNQKIRIQKRKELNISENTLLIGHVGRFNKQKNHEFLIDIFNEIQKKHKDSKLLLVGIGPLMENIKSKVKEYNLENSVLFLGQRNDVQELMQAMDIFLLPSLYEGLPLVGVEAQAAGLKCIFSDKITKEIKLLKGTEFLPLKKETWKKIDKYKQNVKRDNYNKSCNKYNIVNCAQEIYSKYMELGS